MIIDDQVRAIGKIVRVGADRFLVEMHSRTDNFTVVGFDDVHYTARLGSLLMVPVQSDYIVVEIIGLSDKDIIASGNQEQFETADSAKFLDVIPVGMLPQESVGKFTFGVTAYPSLYTDVLYSLDTELDRVLATEDYENLKSARHTSLRALSIGRSIVFDNYDVKVRINDFFGGHSTVLGNTGSGKSCTVSAILQALLMKQNEYFARGATFIIFDVNGEYNQAFSALPPHSGVGVDHLILDERATSDQLRLPHWLLEQSEWEMLLQASERTQTPVLRMALGFASLFSNNDPKAECIKKHIIAKCVMGCFMGGGSDSAVHNMSRAISILQKYAIDDLNVDILNKHGASQKYGNFEGDGLVRVLESLDEYVKKSVQLPTYNHTPFAFSALEECLEFAILYDEANGNKQIRDYCASMMTRVKSLKDRDDYNFLKDERSASRSWPSYNKFLEKLFGLHMTDEGAIKQKQIVIIDMNSVDDEIIEVVSSVIARMTFKMLRTTEPRNCFPIHLVLEEAHRYIATATSRYALEAAQIYERIAKEGRKYGLFLLIASQRPSELSKTVLSQCSNFIIHRILNPDDLAHIRLMTPFISESVLKRLPSIPKQHALVFGTSVNLPTMFRVRDANPIPKSDDANIVDSWFHEDKKVKNIQIS